MRRLYAACLVSVVFLLLGLVFCVSSRRNRRFTTVSAVKFFVSGKPRQILQVENASTKLTSPISKTGKATNSRRTLYTWSNDTEGSSTWKESNWPLVYVRDRTVKVARNVSASVSIARGPAGSRGMLLINGFPVYQYVVDTSPADFRGEGIAPSETNIPPGIWQTVGNQKGPLLPPDPAETIARPGLLTDQCAPQAVQLCSVQMVPTDSLVCVGRNSCELANYSNPTNPCSDSTVRPCGYVAPLCLDKKCCDKGGTGCELKAQCSPYKGEERSRSSSCPEGHTTCRCIQDRFNNRLGKKHKHAHRVRHLRRKKTNQR